MDREQAKNIWPIIKAFAEGKQVEIKTKEGSCWDILEKDNISTLKNAIYVLEPETKISSI